jgi:hypothetical protein
MPVERRYAMLNYIITAILLEPSHFLSLSLSPSLTLPLSGSLTLPVTPLTPFISHYLSVSRFWCYHASHRLLPVYLLPCTLQVLCMHNILRVVSRSA